MAVNLHGKQHQNFTVWYEKSIDVGAEWTLRYTKYQKVSK